MVSVVIADGISGWFDAIVYIVIAADDRHLPIWVFVFPQAIEYGLQFAVSTLIKTPRELLIKFKVKVLLNKLMSGSLVSGCIN